MQVDAVLADAQTPGSRTAFELRRRAIEHERQVQVIHSGNIATVAEKAAELCQDGPQLARPYDPQGVVDYINRLIADRT